jgi:O-antigen/teichoic acid export membrane protein
MKTESTVDASLKQKTVSGVFWSAVTQVGQQFFNFIIMVILARLLFPEVFGLIAMATVFTGFAGLFQEMGFGAALIQRQEIDDRHLSSVFWLNFAAGLLLTAIVSASAPFIAYFYNEPLLVPLTIVISLNFTIGSFKVVQNALLHKRMDFRQLALITLTSISVAGSISIVLAFSGFGIWSLVANTLLTTVISSALLWRASEWKPRLLWDFSAVKELFGFSTNLLGFRLINYWITNADNLLIGKFLTAAALGLYGRAYSLMLLPVSQISNALARVLFPAFSVIQDDKEKVKAVFLKAHRAIALVTFPMMLGLLIVAKSFILVIYGEKWEGVIPILQIFCLEGMGRSIVTTIGWIYLSQGRTDIQFRWGLFAGVVRIAGIIIGLQWGVIGVAAAVVLCSYLVLWYPALTIAGRLINLKFLTIMENILPVFCCAAIMASAVYGGGLLLPSSWPQWARLITQVPLGMAVYRRLRPAIPAGAETPL